MENYKNELRQATSFELRELLVFMWRSHLQKSQIALPSGVLGLSDKILYANLTFHNVLAWQGSSFCNRARLNFQAFAFRDMKVAAREGCRVGQKMTHSLSFCYWTVLALEEVLILMCRSSRATIFISIAMLLYGRIFVPLRRTHSETCRFHTKLNKLGWHTSLNNQRMKNSRDLILGEVVYDGNWTLVWNHKCDLKIEQVHIWNHK